MAVVVVAVVVAAPAVNAVAIVFVAGIVAVFSVVVFAIVGSVAVAVARAVTATVAISFQPLFCGLQYGTLNLYLNLQSKYVRKPFFHNCHLLPPSQPASQVLSPQFVHHQ